MFGLTITGVVFAFIILFNLKRPQTKRLNIIADLVSQVGGVNYKIFPIHERSQICDFEQATIFQKISRLAISEYINYKVVKYTRFKVVLQKNILLFTFIQ